MKFLTLPPPLTSQDRTAHRSLHSQGMPLLRPPAAPRRRLRSSAPGSWLSVPKLEWLPLHGHATTEIIRQLFQNGPSDGTYFLKGDSVSKNLVEGGR